MKKLICIAALLYCFSFVKAQESDASLKETTDWLTGKLNEVTIWGNSNQFKINISFNGCNCEVIDKVGDTKGYIRSKYVFNLKDISVNSIYQTNNGMPRLHLSTQNGIRVIDYEEIISWKNGVVTEVYTTCLATSQHRIHNGCIFC